ncbi:nuclear transport factor 2 family protein [Kutzneria sp. NPDC052558]|uniref:nuclear transport factor 2 family protein n=1 Tax=Kutzneria sp. NPDC052558 TaxID=3364121 RepID=UPI0037C73C5D
MTDYQLVNEVLARYLRAADHRDPKSMAAVFWPDATVHVYYSGAGSDELLGAMEGADAIGAAVENGMVPHPDLGWSHHTTVNPIVTIDGDAAEYDAQFLVYSALGIARPADGWPEGTSGSQGSITPIESGYVTTSLRRRDGEWRIQRHVIKHDLLYVFPGA